MLSVLPLSPMVLLGVADMVIYRRMEGQVRVMSSCDSLPELWWTLSVYPHEHYHDSGGHTALVSLKYLTVALLCLVCVHMQGTMDSTGGVMSVVREIVAEGSVLNLFNYGLLTAAHAVPGFFSFVAMRYVLILCGV